MSRAVRSGRLIRLRRGWYSTLPAADPRSIAVGAGARLTGISAFIAMGAWVLDRRGRLQLAVPPHASRRDGSRHDLHWEATTTDRDPAVVSLGDALVRVILDEPLERSVPCVDWAFATGRLDRFGWEEVLLRLPRSAHAISAWIDPASQSVLESVARCRLIARGWRVRSQVLVGDVGRIDLVVENAVALELDGRTFHESTFERDRRKDLEIAREGRHSIRVSRRMLVESWSDVELAVAAALAQHRAAGSGGVEVPIPSGRLRARRSRPSVPPESTRTE